MGSMLGLLEWYQWVLLLILLALIGFWFFMRKKGA